jgi:glycosyltransferase involved in cell wall biosynthesis
MPDQMRSDQVRPVGYVLKGYPRRSELFIASEIWRLEQLGVPVRLFVIKGPDEAEHHDVVDRIRAVPRHLPDTTSLSGQPLGRWLADNLAAFRPALRAVARRHPVGLVRAAAATLAQSWRARRGWRLKNLYAKELLQAVALADEVDRAGDVATLHAHFAHGTTTVTWLASMICGLPFSFTAHAKDIYRESLNPAGLLVRKLRAAGFVATCTRANLEHLQALAPEADVHLVYHGLNPDFARLLEAGSSEEGRRPPTTLRVVSVGRQVTKKGFDVLLHAVALLRQRGVEVDLVVVGETGDATPTIHALVEELDLEDVVELRDACGQADLLRLYRGATAFALACRVAEDGDRDGIPNVLVESMAAGLPVVSTAVSGIPELVHDGENGLLVPPNDPAALADALARIGKDPALRERLAAEGPVTVARDFDALSNARRMARLLEGAAR